MTMRTYSLSEAIWGRGIKTKSPQDQLDLETLAVHWLATHHQQKIVNCTKAVALRHGLTGFPPMRWREIAVECGVSKERVRQRHAQAIRSLQNPKFFSRIRNLLEKESAKEAIRLREEAQLEDRLYCVAPHIIFGFEHSTIFQELYDFFADRHKVSWREYYSRRALALRKYIEIYHNCSYPGVL